jgi:hypothetical protein
MTDGSCTDAFTKGMGACPVPPLDEEEEEEEEELEPEPPPPPPQPASSNAEITQRFRKAAVICASVPDQ